MSARTITVEALAVALAGLHRSGVVGSTYGFEDVEVRATREAAAIFAALPAEPASARTVMDLLDGMVDTGRLGTLDLSPAAEPADAGLREALAKPSWQHLAWATWVAEDVERHGISLASWWGDAGNQRRVMRVWLELNVMGPDPEWLHAALAATPSAPCEHDWTASTAYQVGPLPGSVCAKCGAYPAASPSAGLDVERLARALQSVPHWRRETDRYGGGTSRQLALVEVAAAIAAAYESDG